MSTNKSESSEPSAFRTRYGLLMVVCGLLLFDLALQSCHSQDKIQVGDQVLCRINGRLHRGKVLKSLDNGKSFQVLVSGDNRGSTFEKKLAANELEILDTKKDLADAKARLWIYGKDRQRVKGKPVHLGRDSIIVLSESGKRITIPIAKLSVFDRKFIDKFELSESATKKLPPDSSLKPRQAIQMVSPVKINVRQSGTEVKVAFATDWKMKVDSGPGENIQVNRLIQQETIEILPATDGLETLKRFLFSDSLQSVVTQHQARSSDSTQNFLQISSIAGTSDRRVFKLPKEGELRSFGDKVVVTSSEIDLDFWSSTDLTHLKSWRIGRPLEFVWVLKKDCVATYDRHGVFAVWNYLTGKTVFYTQGQPFSRPAISPGKNYAALPIEQGALLLRLKDGQIVGSIKTETQEQASWAFSPDGRRLARSVPQNLSVWSTKDGTQTDDFFQKGTGRVDLRWVDNSHVLVDYRCLLSTEKDFEVWRFTKDLKVSNITAVHSGLYMYSLSNRFTAGSGHTLVPWQVLDQSTQEEIEERSKQAEKIISSGMKFRLDFTQLPLTAGERIAVIRDIRRKCERNGFKVDPTSSNAIRVSAIKAKPDFAIYESRGVTLLPIKFTPYHCLIKIFINDKKVWQFKQTARPGTLVQLAADESLEEYAKRACVPRAEHFLSIQIPENYSRLPFGRDYLGSSRITTAGIVHEND